LRGQLRRFFEIALVLVRFDHVARFHHDKLGASDFLPIHKSGVLPDCAIFAADALLLATLFSKNVLGGTTASHTCLVWGAVIL